MKKILEILKKHERNIHLFLCSFSLVSLFFFDFVVCDYGYSVENSFTGFTMAMNTYIGYFLILLPIALMLSHFVPKYALKRPLLSVVTPILCILSWFLTVIFSKTFNANLSDASLALGAYLTLFCYLLLLLYGILVYKEVISELLGKIKKDK